MVNDLERYKRVCNQIDKLADRSADTFKLFAQLSLSTIAGFLWLKTQTNAKSIEHLLPIARWVLPALAVVTIAQILSDHISWRGFRDAEATLLGREDLRPRFPYSGRLEYFRAAVAAVVGLAGYVWLQ